MTAPSVKVRRDTYRRDSDRCITCGTTARLEWNHRQSSGMGGSKYKPNPADGVTACAICNSAYEADLQSKALFFGWKVRRFCPVPVHEVPVYYPAEATWFLLNTDGTRDAITMTNALELMGIAGVHRNAEEVTDGGFVVGSS